MPRREIRFTAAQDERLRAAAKAASMSIPDFIRYKALGEPPGRQRHLARRERAARERAGVPSSNGSPPEPELPTAVQLSNRMRTTVFQAAKYLDNGMVEVIDGRLFVSGTEIP